MGCVPVQKDTVTLIETHSGETHLGKAARGHRRALRFQTTTSVAVTPCQIPNRSAINTPFGRGQSVPMGPRKR